MPSATTAHNEASFAAQYLIGFLFHEDGVFLAADDLGHAAVDSSIYEYAFWSPWRTAL